MHNVLSGGSPYFHSSPMGVGGAGWNQNINLGISSFLGPPVFAPNPGMMMPMMMVMLNQMMTAFMQGASQFPSHCPCHQQTGLPQPYMNMPWGPPPQQNYPSAQQQHHQPRLVRPQPHHHSPGARSGPHHCEVPHQFPRPQQQVRQQQAQQQAQPRTEAPVPRARPQSASPQSARPQTASQQPQKPATPQTKAHPKTQTKTYDPTKDAAALNKAMHGGMMGLGTDEEAIMKTLRGKSGEEIEALKRNYKDHYGKDLMKDLKSELGSKDLAQATDLMKGDTSKADARKLQAATTGLTDDESAVFETLKGKSAEERKALQTEYKKLTGKDLNSTLKSRFSKEEYQQASALMEGNGAKSDAVKLRDAMSGLTDDEDAVYKTLEGKSKEERAAIQKEFKTLTGKDLSQRMGERLSKTERTRAESLLSGNTAAADAEKIQQAVAGMGTDEKSINEVFEGKSKEERAKIVSAYEAKYGSLDERLSKEMGGNDLEKARSLIKDGGVSDAQKLKYAMEGLGTDEEAVKKVLEGKTKEEVAALKADYLKQTGRQLDADLKSELGGRDEFNATQALKGKAESVEEAVQRANERHAFERKGIGNAISSGVMDLVNDKGELLDKNTARMNDQMKAYKQALAEGRTEDAKIEKARLEQLTGYSNLDVDGYQESKDAVADTAGTVAATAASVAVVVGTAGTATPLVTAALMAGGAGAAAKVGVSAAVSGTGYDAQNIGKDAVSGAVDGAATVVGAGAGRAVAAGIKGAGRGAQIARVVVDGAVDGIVGGAAGGAAVTAVDDATWQDGVEAGLRRVGQSAGMGAALGGVAGGGVAGAIHVAPSVVRGSQKAAQKLVEFNDAGGRVVRDIGQRGLDTAKDLGQRSLDAAKDFGQKGLDTAQGLGRKGLDAAQDLGRKGQTFVESSNLQGRVADATGRAVGDAVEGGKNLWTKFNEFDQGLKTKLRNAVGSGDGSGLTGKAREFFEQAKNSGGMDKLKTLLGDAQAGAGKGLSEAAEGGKGAWTRLKEFDQGLKDKFKQTGDGSGLAGKAKELFEQTRNSEGLKEIRDQLSEAGTKLKNQVQDWDRQGREFLQNAADNSGGKAPELQAKPPEIQAKTPEVQSKTPEIQTKTPEVQSKTPEIQTKTPEVQSKTPEVQSKSPEIKADTGKAPEVKAETAKPPELKTTAKAPDSGPEWVESGGVQKRTVPADDNGPAWTEVKGKDGRIERSRSVAADDGGPSWHEIDEGYFKVRTRSVAATDGGPAWNERQIGDYLTRERTIPAADGGPNWTESVQNGVTSRTRNVPDVDGKGDWFEKVSDTDNYKTRSYTDADGHWNESIMGDNRFRYREGGAEGLRAEARKMGQARLQVQGPNGPIEVNVYGKAGKEQLQMIQDALNDLPPGARQYGSEIYINRDLGEVMTPDGKKVSGVGGMGGDGNIILDADSIRRKGALRELLYHEMGHNADFGNGTLSANSQIWGGKSVSNYGGLNPAEDFAEVHSTVLDNWDRYSRMPADKWARESFSAKKLEIVKMYGGYAPSAQELAQAQVPSWKRWLGIG